MANKLPMNHKTKYTILILGFLVGISFFTIVITMYKKNKFGKGNAFSKGDDSNVKASDIEDGETKEDINKEINGEQVKNNDNALSQDSEVNSNNNVAPEDSFNLLSKQIEKLDFEKLAKNLKIEDQTTSDQLFEELNKVDPEERLAIVERYKPKNEKSSSYTWAKKGFQVGKNIFNGVYAIVKGIMSSTFLCSRWLYEKINIF